MEGEPAMESGTASTQRGIQAWHESAGGHGGPRAACRDRGTAPHDHRARAISSRGADRPSDAASRPREARPLRLHAPRFIRRKRTGGRVVSVEGARQRLQASLRDLKSQWEVARSAWQDATAETFGDRYIEELEQAVRTAMPAMEKMAETLVRVRRECGDPM
ncbi:MAG: WXG100 family type VII secretion target [Planctomycetes bacterium]|nr:WXG100 family type VII secretion target [Planctomycetota bacterium]